MSATPSVVAVGLIQQCAQRRLRFAVSPAILPASPSRATTLKGRMGPSRCADAAREWPEEMAQLKVC